MRRRHSWHSIRIGTALLSLLATTAVAGPAWAVCATDSLPSGRRVAELQTSLVEICIELLDDVDEAPGHVENFVWYVDNGQLVGTFIHRSVPGFVIQGADFRIVGDEFDRVPPRPDWTVVNEPCDADTTVGGLPACSVRGNEAYTVALAKLPGDPDSGSKSWFVNLEDNRTTLDRQNGGFTVFGRITEPSSQAVVDAIAALETVTNFDYSNLFWVDDDAIALEGQPVATQAPYLPFPAPEDGDFGCSDMRDQASILRPDLSNLLFELYEPVGVTPIYETVSAACGDPLTIPLVTWVPQPGPPSCPDLDRVAIRSIEPTAQTGVWPEVPRPFEYVTYTCDQLAEATTQRDAYKQAHRDHFYTEFAPNLVYIEDVTIRTAGALPAPEPSSTAMAAAGLAAFAWLRNRTRRRS